MTSSSYERTSKELAVDALVIVGMFGVLALLLFKYTPTRSSTPVSTNDLRSEKRAQWLLAYIVHNRLSYKEAVDKYNERMLMYDEGLLPTPDDDDTNGAVMVATDLFKRLRTRSKSNSSSSSDETGE